MSSESCSSLVTPGSIGLIVYLFKWLKCAFLKISQKAIFTNGQNEQCCVGKTNTCTNQDSHTLSLDGSNWTWKREHREGNLFLMQASVCDPVANLSDLITLASHIDNCVSYSGMLLEETRERRWWKNQNQGLPPAPTSYSSPEEITKPHWQFPLFHSKEPLNVWRKQLKICEQCLTGTPHLLNNSV